VMLDAQVGKEPGLRLYQWELGKDLVESSMQNGRVVSGRTIGTEWGHGFTWKPNPADKTDIDRFRFRICFAKC